MKIFGKVKSNAGASATSAAEKKDEPLRENESDVPSYFASAKDTSRASPKKKKQRNNDVFDGGNIEELLEMDFSKLNSKQRRLVRRHQAREGYQEGVATEETKSPATDGKNDQDKAESAEKSAEVTTDVVPKAEGINDTNMILSLNISDIVQTLDGLNSKERRKFLRKLRSEGKEIDEQLIAAAKEEAKKVAERNEMDVGNSNSTSTTESKSESGGGKRNASESPGSSDAYKQKRKRKRKGTINLEDLPPEERARREEQRRMQIEAAERRAVGLVDPNRHPLNSERRRANRRKPGKAALIAKTKKERMSEGGEFNAVGYQMRKRKN